MIEIPARDLDAAIFDMDGVVTQTATLHEAAWKRLFDQVLDARRRPGEDIKPFAKADYLLYVDGRSRYDGVALFLSSRGIELPFGSPTDPPIADTACGLANLKDAYFWRLVEERGVAPFKSTLEFIRALRAAGIKTGVFSASRNAAAILRAAGASTLFDDRMDGELADKMRLPGKPSPATLVELVQRLGTVPGRTLVVEDAVAGVQAGRDGGFALVLGVNRTSETGRLLASGAHIEVPDLAEVGLMV